MLLVIYMDLLRTVEVPHNIGKDVCVTTYEPYKVPRERDARFEFEKPSFIQYQMKENRQHFPFPRPEKLMASEYGIKPCVRASTQNTEWKDMQASLFCSIVKTKEQKLF